MNRLLLTDSYKHSHYKLYPANTTSTFSYLESRGSERDYEETLFFGLQYILKKYLANPITLEEVEEARELMEAHGEPFNYEGWKLLIDRHGGKLPLRIRAVPEGKVISNHAALVTVENTDPDFYWLVSFVESLLLHVWYSSTVATQSHYLKKLIYRYLVETSDSPEEEISFKLHDFGFRGVSSVESSGIGGLAHLISFRGTDTLPALVFGRKYYNCDMAGFSIPAGEHSTFSSWGKNREVDAYRNMLKQFGKTGAMLAVVSDTWDVFNACENIWGEELRQEVIDSGATVVIRPDSGDPVTVVMRCLNILANKFGTTDNYKGYKVLNTVRLIQGDGVNPQSIKAILEAMKAEKFSATNIAFGMGGALLQKVDRDTNKFAYKCSSATIDGKVTEVYKDPITDKGKTSKRGRLDTIQIPGYLPATIKLKDEELSHPATIMRTVYEDGKVYVNDSLDLIRQRALTNSYSCATV